MRMTLYRMMASDEHTMLQAQYALSSHQEEVKKEVWFVSWVMEHLFRQINGKAEELEMVTPDLVWQGWTEVWKYAGEMEWDVQEEEH